MNNGLHTIREIWLGESERYFIPSYQRGYKWTVMEVRKLLEDIDRYMPLAHMIPYYCLQNITIKKDGNVLSVIDGQQRLTTTLVILSFFKWKHSQNVEQISSELVYGVRAQTQEFLKEEILSGQIWELPSECGDEVFLARDGNDVKALHEGFRKRLSSWEREGKRDRNHSDIFHLYCAALTVQAYFAQSDVEWTKFELKFLDKAKFLVNPVADSMSESKMFSKINGFRVPLDGADLLRAIFITDVARARVEASGEMDSVRREIRLAEERVKLGVALDDVAAWWGENAHKSYFHLFDRSIEDVGHAFDAEQYPINHLYKLYEAKGGLKKIRLEDFEKRRGESAKLFEEILQLQSVLKDWYEDRYIYHYAGYLCAQCGKSFHDLYQVLLSKKSRKDLYKELKRQIFDYLMKRQDDELPGQSEGVGEKRRGLYECWLSSIDKDGNDWYGDEEFDVGKILILLDVIAFTQDRSQDEDAYHPLSSHLDVAYFEIRKEDKEHIFPQTPIGAESMKDKKALKTAVEAYWKLIVNNRDEEEVKRSWMKFWAECESKDPLRETAFSISEITDADYEWLIQDQNDAREKTKKRINCFVAKELGIDLNSIGNIVLLNAGTNRSYGNDFYPRKRQRILSDYRKNLSIRLHTRSVFAKEFPEGMETGEDAAFDAWTQNSIVNNRRFIREQIKKFFAEVVYE